MSILEQLIEQSKRPHSWVGKVMLKIMNRAHAGMTKTALAKLQLAQDATILDVGCGGGETIHMLASRLMDGTVYGLDFAEASIQMSTERNMDQVREGKVVIVQGEVSNMPFEDNFFDCVTAIQTHYYWPELAHDLKEIHSVLKTRGQLLIASEIYKVEYHMKQYTSSEEMIELLEHIGYEVQIEEQNKWRYVVGIKK